MTIKDHLKSLLPKSLSAETIALRDEGNRLRDEGKFADAAECYERYLDAKPNDFSIWVQRGNCLKDSGALGAANAAYDEASKLNPNDADLNLQLGHLMKLQGKRNPALSYYKRSLELNPNLSSARHELRSLGVKLKETASPLQAPALQRKSANVFDISDLLIFLAVHSRVTGIQRVQSCIVQEILIAKTPDGEPISSNTVFCYCDQEQQVFYAVSSADVKRLIDTVSSSSVSRSEIDDALSDVYDNKVKIQLRAGDVYCILGAFWVGHDYSGSLWQLKNRQVKIGVYIYDLIPLTHPQFVTESTRQAVVDKFGDVMSLVDFALTISEYVAKEVSYTLETALNRKIPVLAVPLAHALPENAEEDEDVDGEFKESFPSEYVLCVCTLEGRKNHLILLNSWIALNQKYSGRIPTLVLVGKWGWRIEEFQTLLNSSKNVDGKILLLGNLSDRELKHLYQNCLFTVFPSFVEGWGLPVGESLAYGKPCLASNASSIPEVGGEFCRYINPYDLVGTLEAIEKTIFDRKGLKEWTDHVVRDFKVRTWSDVANTFMRRMAEAASLVPQKRPTATVLVPGRVYWLNKTAIYGGASTTAWQNRALKFVCALGWHQFEDWGAWSSRRAAEIAFGTAAPARSKFRVLLQLRLPPPRVSDNMRYVETSGVSKLVQFDNDKATWVSIDTQSDDNGQIKISLERIGTIEQVDDNRPIFVGVSAIAYHQRDDIAARLDVLESIAFTKATA